MRKRGEVMRPKFLMELMEEIGPTKTARVLHTSTTMLHKAKKAKEVTATVELAARGVLHDRALIERLRGEADTGTPPAAPAETPDAAPATPHQPNRLMVLEVPEDDVETLRRLAKTMRLKYLEEPDDAGGQG